MSVRPSRFRVAPQVCSGIVQKQFGSLSTRSKLSANVKPFLIPQGTLCVVIKLSVHGTRCVSPITLIRSKRLFQNSFFFEEHFNKVGPVLYNSCPNLLGSWQIPLCCCGVEEDEAFKNKMICITTVKRKSKSGLIFGPKNFLCNHFHLVRSHGFMDV